jgi:Tol biopolymer transport system component
LVAKSRGLIVRTLILQAFCLAASLTIAANAQSSDEPVVAFATGTTLALASATGRVTQRIDLAHPVYNFALSSDRKLLVTVAPDTATGGNLSFLDLQTHTQTRLTSGHLYFKASEMDKGETEVYNDPQFSPDRRSLAFAIHTDNPGDGNDAINDSGPIAVMDLRSHKVRVLKATENIDGEGLCFANSPMWSPDGRWILFNCENGAFVTDTRGISLRDLKLGTDQDAETSAVSWVGDGCVLYLQSHTTNGSRDPSKDEVLLLNLRTSSSSKPASKMPLPNWIATGLQEASDSAFILQSSAGKTIETSGKEWTFPATRLDFDGYTPLVWPAARIIGGWKPSSIPRECE